MSRKEPGRKEKKRGKCIAHQKKRRKDRPTRVFLSRMKKGKGTWVRVKASKGSRGRGGGKVKSRESPHRTSPG